MPSVLFTHSYFMKFDPKQWGLQQAYPPLGTLIAAALIREKGYEVFLHDVMFADSAKEISPLLEKHNPDYLVIYDDGFNYLTKMCLTNMREAAFSMIGIARQKGCKIIVSSSDASDHFAEYLEHGADYVIIGEAEETLLELINALAQKSDTQAAIHGLAYKKNNDLLLTPKRDIIKNLDSLPLPAWDLVDMDAYRTMWLKRYGNFTINIATTRGCPYHCNWCAKPIYGYAYHMRSPEKVVEELLLLKKNYGFDKVWFCDDIFGLQPDWVQKFNQEVARLGLKFSYIIQSRADLLCNESYVANLAASGCGTVWLGAESGSQKILDAMGKNIKVEQIYTAARLLKKYHIKASFFIQFGYIGENKEDIGQTIKMVNELLPEDIGISISYPLPGTTFYEQVKSDLHEKANWTDSNELTLMFKNTYSPAFYKKLHRYVHLTYRKNQGFATLKYLLLHPLKINYKLFRRVAGIAYYIPASMMAKRKMNKLKNE